MRVDEVKLELGSLPALEGFGHWGRASFFQTASSSRGIQTSQLKSFGMYCGRWNSIDLETRTHCTVT